MSHLHQHQWSRKRSNDHRKLLKNVINISVTYDLAIANVAMQLRAEEKPTYGNTFIHLGLFHITYAFFFYAWKVHSRVRWITYSKWYPCYRKRISKIIPIRLILQQMQKISSITWSSNESFTCPGLCRSVWLGLIQNSCQQWTSHNAYKKKTLHEHISGEEFDEVFE